MFDLGNSEILILIFLALLVLGPEEIPPLARRIGVLAGRLRRMWSHMRSELDREMGLDMLEPTAMPGVEESPETRGRGERP